MCLSLMSMPLHQPSTLPLHYLCMQAPQGGPPPSIWQNLTCPEAGSTHPSLPCTLERRLTSSTLSTPAGMNRPLQSFQEQVLGHLSGCPVEALFSALILGKLLPSLWERGHSLHTNHSVQNPIHSFQPLNVPHFAQLSP